jgi:hypothetical protein
VMRFPTPLSPGHTGRIALLESQKPEALADSTETQLVPVSYPSVPAVIVMDDVALMPYFLVPASQHFNQPRRGSRNHQGFQGQ